MSARILAGRPVADEILEEVADRVARLRRIGHEPTLATVLVGDDPASAVYVRSKRRTAERVGIRSVHHDVDADVEADDLLDLIRALNADETVDGILVQLPLPRGIDEEAVVEAIEPAKDVDGLHPWNLGRLAADRPVLVPCTPQGVMRMLAHYGIDTVGAEAVVVGRSRLVGRPMALLLGARGADATVTVAHSRTVDLVAVTRRADILVAAVGVPRLIGRAHVKPGATVVDVGITRIEDVLVGDVDVDEVAEVAGAVTPVPGGVGPLTVAMLMRNTVLAAERRRMTDGPSLQPEPRMGSS